MDKAEVLALRLIAMRALAVVALMQSKPGQFLGEQREAALRDADAITLNGDDQKESEIRAQVREKIEATFDAVTLAVPK